MIKNIKCRIDNNEDGIIYNRGDFDGIYVSGTDEKPIPLWQVLCDLLYINSNADTIIICERTIRGFTVKKVD